VTTILLAGTGAVGVRTARQLLETAGVEQLLVTDRRPERAEELATALRAETVPFGVIPDAVSAVALAVPGDAAVGVAREAIRRGISVAAASDDDDGIDALLALDAPARDTGATVVVGCGLAPGLADVLARHAANALDDADEVHVARVGTAGEACETALRRARRERPAEWRADGRRFERRLGPELVWFPDPVGARECLTVATGIQLLHDAVPGVTRATVRAAEPPRRQRAFAARRRAVDGWGAARVEVWGWRDRVRDALVYGVIERPGVAAGTVLAVAAARVAGQLIDVRLREPGPGSRGLAALVEPAPFLAELARRGVKAAAFEGVAVA
jgi:hypothetical protein